MKVEAKTQWQLVNDRRKKLCHRYDHVANFFLLITCQSTFMVVYGKKAEYWDVHKVWLKYS